MRGATTRQLLTCMTLIASGALGRLAANGSEPCACAHCGGATTRAVCRLVCEETEVPVICWGVQDEDFCLPGHSVPGCEHCEVVCEECDPQGKVRSGPSLWVWRDWCPNPCGDIFTRRKLMKKTLTRTVPSYQWKVEMVCDSCRDSCMAPAAAPVVAPLPATQPVSAEPVKAARGWFPRPADWLAVFRD